MKTTLDLENLKNCIRINPEMQEIYIPATLSKIIYLEKIFLFLKKNKSIKRIEICDDYLNPSDDETEYFCNRIDEDLPELEIYWTREFKIDGRHGR